MIRLLGAATIVAASALLNTAQAAPKADPLEGVHSVGIISAIGEKITLKNVALLVFGNTEDVLRNDGLGIDNDVAGQISRALPASISVKPVVADHDAFSTQATSWSNESEVDVEGLVRKLADRESVDAYIVAYPTPVEDIVFKTNQYLRGLGVYRRHDSTIVYARYRVSVVNAHTGKMVATEYANNGETGFFSIKLPFAPVSDSVWSETVMGLNEQQKKDIRTALMALVEPSLANALKQLGISTPASPLKAE